MFFTTIQWHLPSTLLFLDFFFDQIWGKTQSNYLLYDPHARDIKAYSQFLHIFLFYTLPIVITITNQYIVLNNKEL